MFPRIGMEAIFKACRARFRPILMTTMAALFAGIPLVIATGPGTELRRPLGITIIGGLFVSQILTLYTTPVIYLLIDRLRRRASPEAVAARPSSGAVDAGLCRAYSPAMSEPSVADHEVEAVAECPHCLKPEPLCVCETVTPVESRISLLILQHPQEQDRSLGTARLAALHFRDAVVKIGLSWPSLAKALGRPVADPSRWAVLYLGSAKVSELETDRDIVAINRKGEVEPNQRAILGDIEGVVLLDGTWSQAKALWWRNPWMLKCQRVILGPRQPSRYGALRREPRRDGLSTIEAVGMMVSAMERRPEISEVLNASFERMLARFRDVQRAMPELAPRPKPRAKRDFRRRKRG